MMKNIGMFGIALRIVSYKNVMKSDARYYIVYSPVELMLFKGIFQKQDICGHDRWWCEGEVYTHLGKKYNCGGFTAFTCPIEISKEIYESLECQIPKIQKQKDLLVASIKAIVENEAKKLKK